MSFQTTKKCPKCGKRLTEIVYGEPTPEVFEASERGEIILGGCCVSGLDYYYDNCKMKYSRDFKYSEKIEEEEFE